jgi:6-phosphogluconolactonase
VKIAVLPDSDAAAVEAARFIADEARRAVAERGRFSVALSGGRTPWRMLRALAGEDLPWQAIDVFQTDERVAPAGDPDRNLTQLRECLGAAAERIQPMPVEAQDLDGAAADYAETLARIAGRPPLLDLVHLGLGLDGHAASLVPGDPALGLSDAEVALTRRYRGRRRMTLTYPILNRARRILWLIAGTDKAEPLARLLDRDKAIPAARIHAGNAVVIADEAAAASLRADIAEARV